MQRSKILLILWISLIIIAWGRNDSYCQASVTIPDIKTEIDSTILVPVLVSDLSSYGIISYQFQVNFDSVVIRANGIAIENTLTAQWGNAAVNTDSADKMIVGAFGISALTAGDTLIKLVFDVIAEPGDSTLIIMDDFKFNNDNPKTIIDNGSVMFKLPGGIYNRISATIPRKMKLLYNYPEPVQDRTSIVVNLDKPGQSEIEIYNVLGQNIRHLGISFMNAARFSVDWDVTDDRGIRVPPGIYFCAVKQNDKIIAVERMVLVK